MKKNENKKNRGSSVRNLQSIEFRRQLLILTLQASTNLYINIGQCPQKMKPKKKYHTAVSQWKLSLSPPAGMCACVHNSQCHMSPFPLPIPLGHAKYLPFYLLHKSDTCLFRIMMFTHVDCSHDKLYFDTKLEVIGPHMVTLQPRLYISQFFCLF